MDWSARQQARQRWRNYANLEQMNILRKTAASAASTEAAEAKTEAEAEAEAATTTNQPTNPKQKVIQKAAASTSPLAAELVVPV